MWGGSSSFAEGEHGQKWGLERWQKEGGRSTRSRETAGETSTKWVNASSREITAFMGGFRPGKILPLCSCC